MDDLPQVDPTLPEPPRHVSTLGDDESARSPTTTRRKNPAAPVIRSEGGAGRSRGRGL